MLSPALMRSGDSCTRRFAVSVRGRICEYTLPFFGLQMEEGRKKALPGKPGRALNTLVS
jgi:hypothetical protein